jgi:general secretion pathway protein M
MKAYWDQMNERERWMVGSTLILCILYAFYLFWYAPLTAAVEAKRAQFQEKSDTLRWMKSIDPTLIDNAPTQKSLTTTDLLSEITTKLKQSTLNEFAYQLTQSTPNTVQLRFERVPFNPLMNWLWQIDNAFKITIDSMIIDKTDVSGLTQVVLVLKVG